MPTESVPGEGPIPGSQTVPSPSRCVLTRWRGERALWGPFHKGTDPFREGFSLIIPQIPDFLIRSHGQFGFNLRILEHTNKTRGYDHVPVKVRVMEAGVGKGTGLSCASEQGRNLKEESF